ncbi:helix-turn-helix transcriptional regulator [Pseudoxanthomonas sacheonensis]|uniref:helix-turn-helix transcriptional regulator n=1 Tax=Pseudoxanthomonas sacheonensis TaxID=443615 RepID=UPI0013D8D25D|nr:AraC family transcriptional regulator [Pseudoxanthomonas sacheonensis]KAF1707499.1 AraC family transcriptional regulator [Pseudoxanthomonas sacheonensis]
MSTPSPAFAYGRFLGDYRAQREVGALALAELRPTVPEHDVHEHTHEDAHFLLLLQGNYLSSAQGMPLVCSKRALVLNPPGTTHRDRFRGLDGLFFTVSVPAAVWRQAQLRRPLPASAVKLPGSTLVRAACLWRELRAWDTASTLSVESGFEELLDAAAEVAQAASRSGPAWLRRVRDMLADEWRRTPGLAELAHQADVHPVYLARAFRRHYGCSPGTYLRRCRMDRAIDLLGDTGLSVAEVAASCGFVDQAHFTHVFRRAHRVTPSQYRALG